MTNLCLAGGVALNCVGNGRIQREQIFDRIWIQPAAGDAGGALGVAWLIWHKLLGNPRQPEIPDAQQGSLLGPSFDSNAIESFLNSTGARYHRSESQEHLCETVSGLLADGKVVGWMQGRMEFGPRALGNRSILGDPRDPDMQSRMNLKIKFRESFRPFAPSVLAERAHAYFDLPEGQDSPYMLLVPAVNGAQRLDVKTAQEVEGLARLRLPRSTIPAVTHVDYSARVQTVDATRNPLYHKLLTGFERRTGCPLLINTSFNIRGEPIVCTPEDAYRCFMATQMDVLALGDFWLLKEEQPASQLIASSEYQAQFAPD